MIAEKLLACATPAPPPRGTLFLAFAQGPAGGAPEAVIGQLVAGHSGITLNGAGGAIVQSASRAGYAPLPAASFGAGDFLLDVVFDGTNAPSIIPVIGANFSYSVAITDNYVYVSTSGLPWNYYTHISPSPGQNHVAVGRQSGVVQAWLNGSRIFRAEDAATGAAPVPHVFLEQWPLTGADMTVHSVRICYGVDLYGDSATITVPTLPLGIV